MFGTRSDQCGERQPPRTSARCPPPGVASFAHQGSDARRSLLRVLVLPHPNDGPSCPGKVFIDLTIALNVAAQLRHPVTSIGPRHPPVHGTAVPEAAVDEHGDSRAREDDVWTNLSSFDNQREILAESQPATVEVRPEPDLRDRVLALVSLTNARCRSVRRHRIGNTLAAAKSHRSAASSFSPCRDSRLCCHTLRVYYAP